MWDTTVDNGSNLKVRRGGQSYGHWRPILPARLNNQGPPVGGDMSISSTTPVLLYAMPIKASRIYKFELSVVVDGGADQGGLQLLLRTTLADRGQPNPAYSIGQPVVAYSGNASSSRANGWYWDGMLCNWPGPWPAASGVILGGGEFGCGDDGWFEIWVRQDQASATPTTIFRSSKCYVTDVTA
jgi:hypothetical protein